MSSVLPPQGVWTYEPRNLSRPDDGGRSWCEGVPGHGIGETITLRIEGGSAFRRLLIANGYGKSRESYFANARVKEIEITTDTGIRTRAQVVDQNPLLPIYLPFPAEHDWIRIKILDVYPGTKYQDTCIDFLTPDFEYEETLLQESQQMDEGGQAPNGQLPENPDGAQGAECVTTGEIIEGTLALSQSLHPSGEQMNSLHVVLDAPTCFSIGATSIEARAVQLIFTSTLEAHRLTRLAGKRIKLKGQFFPPSTAWHTGDIIIIEPQYFLVE